MQPEHITVGQPVTLRRHQCLAGHGRPLVAALVCLPADGDCAGRGTLASAAHVATLCVAPVPAAVGGTPAAAVVSIPAAAVGSPAAVVGTPAAEVGIPAGARCQQACTPAAAEVSSPAAYAGVRILGAGVARIPGASCAPPRAGCFECAA